jgi:two-component system chemotaxis response regulator CheB
MRKIISEMINNEPGFEVIATARDGEDGVNKAIELKPDLITLDIEMPRKDGLSALREIKAKCHAFNPIVLMCSSLTVAGSHETFKALRIGAADFIGKDPAVVGQKDEGFRAELISKLKALSASRKGASAGTSKPNAAPAPAGRAAGGNSDIIDLSRVRAVAVGSSTGGPPVLEEIFSSLSAGLGCPIIVAQHMPELFTQSLASRLDQQCACSAWLATSGSMLDRPGIHICQGGTHTRPTRVAGAKVITRQVEHIDGAIYRPSVDALFEASAQIWGDGLLAIQLTGMGADGADGAQKVKAAGGQVITQAGSTCVVNGMPKAVVDAGASDVELTPGAIKDLLTQLSGSSASSESDQKPNLGSQRCA